jgi:DNA-directed RNA polymerase specialized sigma24 family protein
LCDKAQAYVAQDEVKMQHLLVSGLAPECLYRYQSFSSNTHDQVSLKTLSKIQRVVMIYNLCGYRPIEIAKLLKKQRREVDDILFRARNKLHQ